MNASERMHGMQRGVGLIEVMISIIIGMLLVLVIYQVYEVSESQKRTITAGSDAQQNAGYGLYALGRDLSMAGNGIASSASALDKCAILRPIPFVIKAGATPNDPDEITVLYGGSSSLSTSVPFQNSATTAQPYAVRAPVGFSPNDVIAAVQRPPGTQCTVSTINAAAGSVVVNAGLATLTHTPVPGSIPTAYVAGDSLVNLGKAGSLGRVVYSVDTTTHTLRTQNQLPTLGPVNPVISEVVNLKAQYGLDIANNGVITWQDATGAWDYAVVTAPPPPGAGPLLATLQQIRAVRIAIVTRSAQCDLDPVTHQCMVLTRGPLKMFDDTVSWTLNANEQIYRYKVLETIVPIRNALWNAP